MTSLATDEAFLGFIPSTSFLFSEEFELASLSSLILESFKMILFLLDSTITVTSRFALNLERWLLALGFKVSAGSPEQSL